MSFSTAIEPLLDCLCDALGSEGWEGECCIVAARPSIEACCNEDSDEQLADAGRAWARIVRAYPSKQFPQEDREGTNTDCFGSTQWALVVELGASYCICADCGCESLALGGDRGLRYGEHALQAVNCCLASGPHSNREIVQGGLTYAQARGGCSAFTIELTMSYDLLCCPPEAEES